MVLSDCLLYGNSSTPTTQIPENKKGKGIKGLRYISLISKVSFIVISDSETPDVGPSTPGHPESGPDLLASLRWGSCPGVPAPPHAGPSRLSVLVGRGYSESNSLFQWSPRHFSFFLRCVGKQLPGRTHGGWSRTPIPYGGCVGAVVPVSLLSEPTVGRKSHPSSCSTALPPFHRPCVRLTPVCLSPVTIVIHLLSFTVGAPV